MFLDDSNTLQHTGRKQASRWFIVMKLMIPIHLIHWSGWFIPMPIHLGFQWFLFLHHQDDSFFASMIHLNDSSFAIINLMHADWNSPDIRCYTVYCEDWGDIGRYAVYCMSYVWCVGMVKGIKGGMLQLLLCMYLCIHTCKVHRCVCIHICTCTVCARWIVLTCAHSVHTH